MRIVTRLLLAVAATAAVAGPAHAQRQSAEQFYLPGAFNWSFLRRYGSAARLFNAFDYGHAVLYETLYTRPDSSRAAERLEREYRFLTQDLLRRPPRFAVAEEAVAPRYAQLAWPAMLMFDWAHVLHRQIYDIYADERLTDSTRVELVERATDYYLSRRDIAFVPVPKDMALMDEQYFSQEFRRRHAAFNGLIWAYHWLQVGLYEPLLLGDDEAARHVGVEAALARFWEMLGDPPGSRPRVMPMASAVAPVFSARHPRAAVIFDNLHMVHDIISDILASERIPLAEKRRAIDVVLAEFRNPTTNVISMDHWRMMADHMGGIEAMGGAVPRPGMRAPDPSRP